MKYFRIAPNIVRIGEEDLKIQNENSPIEIERIIVHPQYDHNYQYNDIALAKLHQSVTINQNIHPACLWGSGDLSFHLDATGYGRNGNDTLF